MYNRARKHQTTSLQSKSAVHMVPRFIWEKIKEIQGSMIPVLSQ